MTQFSSTASLVNLAKGRINNSTYRKRWLDLKKIILVKNGPIIYTQHMLIGELFWNRQHAESHFKKIV